MVQPSRSRSTVLRCPVCGKAATEQARPFCSARCAEVDLGRWLTGQYRLPGPVAELDEDPPREPGSGG